MQVDAYKALLLDKSSVFLNFLNLYVWSSKLKIGELEIVYLFSHHDPKDYNCTQVDVIDAKVAKTPRLKFFARPEGMRVEFIIHTNQSYLNYRYQLDMAHEEYEVRYLFDSGVT